MTCMDIIVDIYTDALASCLLSEPSPRRTLCLKTPAPTAGGVSRTLCAEKRPNRNQCDRDGSGGVSLEEYVAFSAREKIPRSMAETTFFQADVDGNGKRAVCCCFKPVPRTREICMHFVSASQPPEMCLLKKTPAYVDYICMCLLKNESRKYC